MDLMLFTTNWALKWEVAVQSWSKETQNQCGVKKSCTEFSSAVLILSHISPLFFLSGHIHLWFWFNVPLSLTVTQLSQHHITDVVHEGAAAQPAPFLYLFLCNPRASQTIWFSHRPILQVASVTGWVSHSRWEELASPSGGPA